MKIEGRVRLVIPAEELAATFFDPGVIPPLGRLTYANSYNGELTLEFATPIETPVETP